METIKKINIDGIEYNIKTEPIELNESHPAYIPPTTDGDLGSFNIWELETGEYVLNDGVYLNYSNYDMNMAPLETPLQFQIPGWFSSLRVYHSPGALSICEAICESGSRVHNFTIMYGQLTEGSTETVALGTCVAGGGVASGESGSHISIYEWDGTDAGYNESMFSYALHDVAEEGTAIIVNTALEYDKYHLGRIYILDSNLGDPITENDKLYYILQSPASNVQTALSAGSDGNYHTFKTTTPRVQLEVDSTDPTTVKAITLSEYTESISAVKPGYDYPNPYMPSYDGSPATKKYVDDTVSSALANTSTPTIKCYGMRITWMLEGSVHLRAYTSNPTATGLTYKWTSFSADSEGGEDEVYDTKTTTVPYTSINETVDYDTFGEYITYPSRKYVTFQLEILDSNNNVLDGAIVYHGLSGTFAT